MRSNLLANKMKKKKKYKPKQVYVLPDSPLGTHFDVEKSVLGLDPGSRNFGISLVGLSKENRPVVFANSVLMHPVNDLVNFGKGSEEFLNEIRSWTDMHTPSGIVGERFQTRGNMGPLIEQVSAMLGLIRGRYSKIPLKLTVASAWKNKIRRRFGVDLKELYPEIAVQPHQLDATLIAIFGLESGLNRDLDYSLEDVVAQCEATSLIDLKNNRRKLK